MICILDQVSIAAKGLEAQAGNGTVGKGAAKLARSHGPDAVVRERQHRLSRRKILYRGGHGMSIVGTAQLAFVTTHYPIAYYLAHPFRQAFVVILDEQAREAARGIHGTIVRQGSRWTSIDALATVPAGHRAGLVRWQLCRCDNLSQKIERPLAREDETIIESNEA